FVADDDDDDDGDSGDDDGYLQYLPVPCTLFRMTATVSLKSQKKKKKKKKKTMKNSIILDRPSPPPPPPHTILNNANTESSESHVKVMEIQKRPRCEKKRR
ncbi:MAG: hypothetical protein Q9217_006517, partial [Psora testacea]